MAWVTPQPGTAGQVYTAAAHNVIVDDLTEFAPLFAAWTSYTPTIDQGATTNITKTVNKASYVQIGKLVIWHMTVTITGTGTAANSLVFSYPGGIQPASGGIQVGSGTLYDTSTSTSYFGSCQPSGVVVQRFALVGDWAGIGVWGTTPNLAIANGDIIRFSGMYETA